VIADCKEHQQLSCHLETCCIATKSVDAPASRGTNADTTDGTSAPWLLGENICLSARLVLLCDDRFPIWLAAKRAAAGVTGPAT
jgi:hypothetical protein